MAEVRGSQREGIQITWSRVSNGTGSQWDRQVHETRNRNTKIRPTHPQLCSVSHVNHASKES